MLTSEEIDKLEKRALGGLSGYTADVNITCYVYGKDVLALLNDRREILAELDMWKRLADGRGVSHPPLPNPEVVLQEAQVPGKKGGGKR